MIPDEFDLRLLHEAQACLQSRKSGLARSRHEDVAFQRLYDLYDPLLRCFVAACSLKGEDAEDCLQESWTAISEDLPGFATDGTQDRLCSWLHAIVRNKAADIRRGRTRHPAKPLEPKAETSIASRDAGPVAAYEQHCAQETVRQLLERLHAQVPELTYVAFHRHWIEQKTTKEIASEMHLTPHGVSCRIYKASEVIRKMSEHTNSNRGGVTDPWMPT